MTGYKRVVRTILITAALAGCTGSPNYWVTYSAARGEVKAPRAAVIQSAVVAVTDAGREVESSDTASGIVLTKWFSGDGFGSDQNRFRIRVTVAESGAYEVVALCQGKDTSMTNHGAWIDCTEVPNSRPRFVVDLVARVDENLRKTIARSEPAQVPTAAPRGFYCSSNTTAGTCAREKAACDATRTALAAPDLTACTLTELAWCFDERCSPTKELCEAQRSAAGDAAECVEAK